MSLTGLICGKISQGVEIITSPFFGIEIGYLLNKQLRLFEIASQVTRKL